MANKQPSYLLHILGCLLFLSIPILSSPDLNTNTELFDITPFRRNFLAYILLAFFFYANYLYLIPRLYFNRRYVLFFAGVAACYAIVLLLPKILLPLQDHAAMAFGPPPGGTLQDGGPMTDDFASPPGDFRGPGPGFFFLPGMRGSSLLQFTLVFSLSFLLRINQRLEHMKNEKLKTEVSYLKAQINPHFLFNTLNSLYALALEKSDSAPEAILKLSAMMRYVVTESGRDTVPLDNEISYVKNYIALQHLRMDGNMPFTFITSGIAAGKQISPMLLIPFVENAFKYGINPDEDAAIDIHIDITDTRLLLNVKNNKVTVHMPAEGHSGHGVDNTRQRLEYMYPERHKLLIFDTAEQFEVQLTIHLV